MNKEEALLICNHIPGLGRSGLAKLLTYFNDDPCAIFEAEKSEIYALTNQSELITNGLLLFKENKGWQSDLREVEKQGVMLLCYTSPNYPKALLEIGDFPHLLYVKGEITKEETKSAAIIGTRSCSIYGSEMAAELARDLSAAGVIIVSGFARGIDTSAHLAAAREKGITYAILGSGLSKIYPSENRSIIPEILEKGALISEFPMLASPEKHHFPKRNRIVSGLSEAVILIESPLKGGAMITMDLAHTQGKISFALPGRVDVPSFCGNLQLLKSQKARLVENSDDVLSLMGIKRKHSIETYKKPNLSEDEEKVYSCFDKEEISLEILGQKSGLSVSKLSSLVMSLLLKKLIKEFPGRMYKRERGCLKI